ncbi:hypothetical protein TRVA0_001S06238 [Trichomonascus vanleenenianus]|uniref:uncharacterized protein n=1 Tax=Trichomonascus vanleenenianus TaxID=2268995 RepID=UPI003ECBAF37
MKCLLLDLPLELQYLVLDKCDPQSLANLLVVSHRANTLVKEALAYRVRSCVGLPRSMRDASDKLHSNLVLGLYSVDEDIRQAHWYDTNYIATNNLESFHYSFDGPYSSTPSTTCPSPALSLTSEPEEEDLTVHSKFTPEIAEDDVYYVCIDEDDDFGQIYITTRMKGSMVPLVKVAQRIHKEWCNEDEMFIHKRGLAFKLQVWCMPGEPQRNEWGGFYRTYAVKVTEITLNSAYMMNRMETVNSSTLIVNRLSSPMIVA